MTTYTWIPWGLHVPAAAAPFGWLRVARDRWLTLNLVEYDDVVLWNWGPLALVRGETDQERETREEAEAENCWLEFDPLYHYADWQ